MTNSNDPIDPKKDEQLPDTGVPSHDAAEDSGTRALAEALRSSFVIVKIVMILLVVVSRAGSDYGQITLDHGRRSYACM